MTRLFRKKPVIVSAVQWTGDNWAELSDLGLPAPHGPIRFPLNRTDVVIRSPEGSMTASPGDWIIKGVAGEVYTCKPEIFDQTHEEVVQDAETDQIEVPLPFEPTPDEMGEKPPIGSVH